VPVCCLLIVITFDLFIGLRRVSTHWKPEKILYNFGILFQGRSCLKMHHNRNFRLLCAVQTDLTSVAFSYELSHYCFIKKLCST
jgi:hypothetical protein